MGLKRDDVFVSWVGDCPAAGRRQVWQFREHGIIFGAMDTLNVGTGAARSLETEAERKCRHAREVDMIARADADGAAGRLVDEAAVDAWIDSAGTNRELPVRYAKS